MRVKTLLKKIIANITNKKLVKKNKYSILLASVIVIFMLSSGKIVPNVLIRMVNTLLGKIISVSVILYVSSKNMTHGILLTLLFVYTVSLFNARTTEFFTLSEQEVDAIKKMITENGGSPEDLDTLLNDTDKIVQIVNLIKDAGNTMGDGGGGDPVAPLAEEEAASDDTTASDDATATG
jgi:hypothetical protein